MHSSSVSSFDKFKRGFFLDNLYVFINLEWDVILWLLYESVNK